MALDKEIKKKLKNADKLVKESDQKIKNMIFEMIKNSGAYLSKKEVPFVTREENSNIKYFGIYKLNLETEVKIEKPLIDLRTAQNEQQVYEYIQRIVDNLLKKYINLYPKDEYAIVLEKFELWHWEWNKVERYLEQGFELTPYRQTPDNCSYGMMLELQWANAKIRKIRNEKIIDYFLNFKDFNCQFAVYKRKHFETTLKIYNEKGELVGEQPIKI